MQIRQLPEDTQIALMAILQKYAPELTPPRLVAAIRAYEPEGTGAKGDIEKPMTRREVQALLRLSEPTVDKLIREGRLRKIKSGIRRVYIDRRSVEEYLQS